MRYSYSLDNDNRLVVKSGSGKNKPSVCLDGSLKVDENNCLVYQFNDPESWRKQLGLPQQVIFSGSWKINPRNCLELELEHAKSSLDRQNSLVINGRIIDTSNNKLVFEAQSIDKQGQLHLRIIKLAGYWAADDNNRLNFVLIKNTQTRAIVFKGVWQMGSQQELEYILEKENLKTKTKTSRTLRFNGFWQVSEENRLVFIITNCLNSYFNFRVQAQSSHLYAEDNLLKYRLGVGVIGKKGYKEKIISIFGNWQINRKAGVNFQVDYGNRVKNIEFGSSVYLTKNDELVFSLLNKKGQPFGLSVIYKHKFFDKAGAQLYLRLKKSGQARSAEIALNIPF